MRLQRSRCGFNAQHCFLETLGMLNSVDPSLAKSDWQVDNLHDDINIGIAKNVQHTIRINLTCEFEGIGIGQVLRRRSHCKYQRVLGLDILQDHVADLREWKHLFKPDPEQVPLPIWLHAVSEMQLQIIANARHPSLVLGSPSLKRPFQTMMMTTCWSNGEREQVYEVYEGLSTRTCQSHATILHLE